MAYRGSSHSLPLILNYPQQVEVLPIFNRKMFYSTSAGNWISSTNKKSHYTASSISTLLFTTAPLNSLTPPHPRLPLHSSCAFRSCVWYAIKPHVPNYNSLLFPNKPFAGETFDSLVSTEHSHTQWFIYCLWLFLCYKRKVE